METSLQGNSKRVTSRVVAYLSAKMGVGPMKVNGTWERWTRSVFASGRMALNTQASGVIASKRAKAHWVTVMDLFTQGISKMITQMGRVRKCSWMVRCTWVTFWMGSFMGAASISSRQIIKSMRVHGLRMRLKGMESRKSTMAWSKLEECLTVV